jgi:hypothetical protein
MNNYRFILEKYNGKNRYTCPQCGKNKEFTRYVDTEQSIQLPEWVGVCNRRDSCGYHYAPKQYFEDNPQLKEDFKPIEKKPKIVSPTKEIQSKSFIPFELFSQSTQNAEALSQNRFIQFLNRLFGIEDVNQLIQRFYIGCSKHWEGATVFWQIDINGQIRSGQVMLYNAKTGKRVKEPFKHIDWVHSILKKNFEKQGKKLPDWLANFQLNQCLFGEHQLRNMSDEQIIAIVEAPKTAIIASAYLPDYVWLAVNGVHNLNPNRCEVLRNRKVVLYPDLNAFELWSKKAGELKTVLNCKITVSRLLEEKANENDRKNSFDLADYLIRWDKYYNWELNEHFYPIFWNED